MMTGVPADRPVQICVPSWRQVTKRVYQCGLYEAEDVLSDVADVDVICVESTPSFQGRHRWHRQLLYHDVTKRLVHVNPGLKRVRLTTDYDLFIVLCQHAEELLYLSAIDGWKERCRKSILVLEEMWASAIPTYRPWLHVLKEFDHVFLVAEGSTDALARETGRPCHWIPGAVDTMRFMPSSGRTERPIDVYSIGRRSEGIHRKLVQLADRSGLFYLYDTVRTAATEAFDHSEHRDLIANIAKRSRHFLVAPAKMNAQAETKGQVEIGYRFYEGAGAGCVLLGQAPDTDSFRRLFDWEDAVITVREDGSDVEDVLRSLCVDRRRLERISRRNAAEALRRHDWVYRWKEILRVAGVPPSARVAAREHELARRADAMEEASV